MKEYERETGKKAKWRGVITEGFKKWLEGEKVYGIDKKVIGVSISDETKEEWEIFADVNGFPTISKFIREVINNYIESGGNKNSITNIFNLSHDLKQSLTTIQGFSQLIIENESKELKPEILSKIIEIYSQSLYLEKRINEYINDSMPEKSLYDILIIEDSPLTIQVLNNYFESKRITVKSVTTGAKGLKELSGFKPKVILVDIILPDITGYKICKKIKTDKNFKTIPVFYITAVPESEVLKNMEETEADGFFLKPFKFPEFEVLFDYL